MNAHINGISLSYDNKGNGPAVLLKHGLPRFRTMWRRQVEALTQRVRTTTLNLFGFDASDIAA